MGAWVLVSEKRKSMEEIDNVNYYDLSHQDRIDVLLAVLNSEDYEVYERSNAIICVYSTIFEEFYTEGGFGSGNLLNFWDGVVKTIHSEYFEVNSVNNDSEYKIQQMEAS